MWRDFHRFGLRVIVAAVMVSGLLGCGYQEAEQARRDAERVRLEALRLEEVAKIQPEQIPDGVTHVAAHVPALPARADNPPRDAPKDPPAASPNLLHTFEGHEDAVICLAFSPDNRKVASGCADGSVRVWDVKNKKELASYKGHKGEVLAVTFGDDGNPISVGVDKMVRHWNNNARKELVNLEGHTDKITCAAFSPTAERVITGSLDKTAIVWEVPTGKKLFTCNGHTKAVSSVRFDSKGESGLTGGQDGKVYTWYQQGEQGTSGIASPHGSWVSATLLWSKGDLTWAINTGTNGLISFSKSSSNLQTIDPRCGALYCLDIFREGERLVSGGEDGLVRLYRLDSYNTAIKEMTKLEGHKDAVKCVLTSPDGKLIVSGGEDKTVRLWQAP